MRKIIARIKHELRVYRLIIKDDRTPRIAKILMIAAVFYMVSPIDLIPDVMPEVVVDLFEIINVQKEHGQGEVLVTTRVNAGLRRVQKGPAIQEPGEWARASTLFCRS